MIKRKGNYLIPTGSSTHKEGDELFGLTENQESIDHVKKIITQEKPG